MIRTALHSFLRKTGGATAIEFAIIAPVLAVLFIGMANLGLRALTEARLNQVTRETAEAAFFSQNLTVLTSTWEATMTELGIPIPPEAPDAGGVELQCICRGSTPAVVVQNCPPATAPTCTLPVEFIVEVSAKTLYTPLFPIPDLFETETLASVLSVQVR